jgi:hypothetical protein
MPGVLVVSVVCTGVVTSADPVLSPAVVRRMDVAGGCNRFGFRPVVVPPARRDRAFSDAGAGVIVRQEVSPRLA